MNKLFSFLINLAVSILEYQETKLHNEHYRTATNGILNDNILLEIQRIRKVKNGLKSFLRIKVR